ncbi:MAG: signal recognition particle-docking protein FtsY [Microcoleaceae cyanobacterium]
MVFNWFRRQKKSNESASEVTPTSPAPEPEPTPAAQSPAQQTTQSPEDYLKWAKAAYQNIQQQKTETPEVAEEQTEPIAETTQTQTEPEETAAEQPSSPVTPVDEVIVETVAEENIAPLAEEPTEEPTTPTETVESEAVTLEPENIAVEAETPETTGDSESPVTATEPETTETSETSESPVSAPAMPLWAQTQAERLARMERLRETAIEEEEEEVAATSATAADNIAFDEMFLWTAEVLANQGRRPDEVAIEEITWLQKLWRGLGRTRRNLLNQLKAIVGQGPLNQAAVDEIESLLLQADVGIDATDRIIAALQEKLKQEALPPEAAIAYLKQVLRDILESPYQNGYSPTFAPEKETLNIWLITGVNGAGKTTTIGKIAHLARKSEYNCLIAAADTFRAAAVEQVKVWGERSGVDVIANPGQNTDPAAVVFDAIAAANSRNAELLLVDTAGRLQNKKNLMEELSKVRRIINKKAPNAVIESLLVLDSTLGQNGLRQAEVFAEAAQLSGVILTKLDGTAKGGVALAVVQQLGLPIRFIGVGESIEDLRPFSSYEFIEALLSG